jgi:hypothetical protein
MDIPVYIEDELAAIVAQINDAPPIGIDEIFYRFGHGVEVAQSLQQLTGTPTYDSKKFPMVWLITDFTVTKGYLGGYDSVKLNIIICNLTQREYKAAERLENNFKPILVPIRDALIDAISHWPQFSVDEKLQYDETFRYFWGTQGIYGNTGNITNDYIDAIELTNFNIYIKPKVCELEPNQLSHSF